MKLTAAWQALKSVVTASTIAAQSSAGALSATVQAAALKLVYEIGLFLILLERSDQFNVSDTMRRDLSKKLSDAFGAIDRHVAHFDKTAADAADITDDQFLSFAKHLHDSAVLAETRVYFLAKALQDNPGAADHLQNAFAKVLVDAGTVAENAALGVYKSASDAAQLIDEAHTQFAKTLADVAVTADFAHRNISKPLQDSVSATDDLDGAATIEDDQEMIYFKTTSEMAGVSDVFYRQVNYVRHFNEDGSLADVQVRAVEKPFTESPQLADGATKSSEKILSEVFSAIDLAEKSSTKPVSNEVSLTDTDSISVGKTVSDTASFSDDFQRVLIFLRSLSDSASAADAIASSLSKPTSDAFAASELIVKSAGLVKANLASVASSGTLRSQGYCEFSYFAEDYVGDSRSFT